MSTPYPDLAIAAFDGGALIAARSFLAVVTGDRVTQDPRFIAGLPEWINWDASDYLSIPDAGARLVGGLPVKTVLSAHAGNRHGPDFGAWWSTHGWTTRRLPRDARLARLPRADPGADELSIAFGSAALVVVRFNAGVDAYVVKAGHAKPEHSTLPIERAGYRHVLVGSALDNVYLCDTTGIDHYDGTSWSSIDTTGFVAVSCAVQSDGTLWVVTDDESARLLRRAGDAWEDEPLPGGAKPTRVAAAGKRAFALGSTDKPQRTNVFSTAPVATTVDVDEHNLPGPLWIKGITGLDVTSVDTTSVSSAPAGPGTSACTSLVAWLGSGSIEDMRRALGPASPKLLEVAGTRPGSIAPVKPGSSQMRVMPSRKQRVGVAARPASYEEGLALIEKVRAARPDAGARLLCATPRVIRGARKHGK